MKASLLNNPGFIYDVLYGRRYCAKVDVNPYGGGGGSTDQWEAFDMRHVFVLNQNRNGRRLSPQGCYSHTV